MSDRTLHDRLIIWAKAEGIAADGFVPSDVKSQLAAFRIGPVTGYGSTGNEAVNACADGLVECGWSDDREADEEALVEGPTHVRVDSLAVGDFIEAHDGYGEVVRLRGPHGPLGTPPSTDWYTLCVLYEGDHHHTVVGPWKGDRIVRSWSA